MDRFVIQVILFIHRSHASNSNADNEILALDIAAINSRGETGGGVATRAAEATTAAAARVVLVNSHPQVEYTAIGSPVGGLCWLDKLMVSENHAVTDRPEIFTIGHSNQPMENFLGLLTQHSIQLVVDSRSHPYSRYVPHFDRELLCASTESRGIRYLYMGDDLGGRPLGSEYYDAEGRVLYYRVAESERFNAGLSSLLRESQ